MKAASRTIGMMFVLVLAPVVADPSRAAAADPPKLDLPKSWLSEDHAYPPPWARDLPWRGDLQVRFPPGWFDEKSPFFWSYPVIYQLDGDVLSSREDLAKALRAYDAGLYRRGFDASKIRLDVGEDRKADKRGHPATRRSITFDGFDPFATRRELTTHLEVFRWYCPESEKTGVLILRSPHPFKEDDPVWKALLPFWETFSCHESKD
jgi:hypothetical protein